MAESFLTESRIKQILDLHDHLRRKTKKDAKKFLQVTRLPDVSTAEYAENQVRQLRTISDAEVRAVSNCMQEVEDRLFPRLKKAVYESPQLRRLAKMNSPSSVQIRRLEIPNDREIEGLSDVLRDCVEGGASVGFMVPLTGSKTEAYWRSVLESATRGERVVLVAEEATGAIVGTVQVIWAQFENQPHRADVAKMLVHRRARRQGIGAALLAAAEHCALSADRTLLVLDTASSDAERLYVRRGWQRVGAVPGYALWPVGGFCSTTIFFKELRGSP